MRLLAKSAPRCKQLNKVVEIISEEIAQRGSITFARFMELALYCPVYGFYELEQDTIGRRGDFYTSVSVGSLFGELLAWQFAEWLEEFWSPEEISRRLRLEFPDDPMMRVSHETIYQSLFVQGRGALRRELTRCLRSGRTERRPQGRAERRARFPGMVTISERPAEVDDRAVPGHWEGDLIIGQNGESAIATLVERSTRYVMLARVADQTATTVREAITAQILTLPGHLRRSLTWDRGKEMSQHLAFTVDTDIDVYFCDPRSPWQRGSNENTNGLLRQYFPKGTDLSTHSQEQLNAAAASLNNRPRETLGWKKPSEKLAELLAVTT